MGTYTEEDARDRVWLILRDYGQTTAQQLLNDTEIVAIGLRGAEPIYSRVRPLSMIDDLTANGTAFLPLPTEFTEALSTVNRVESPPDQVPAEVIDPRFYYVGRDGSGAYRLVFESAQPANGAAVRIEFSALRSFAPVAADTTVIDADFMAVCTLAASLCADSIAAKYARTSEPAFNADVVNYRTRTQEWQSIARRLWQVWQETMGIAGGEDGAGGGAPSAGTTINWDSRPSYGGSRINHPRSWA